MKKILFAALMILATIFVVSCSGEDEIANALGKSCATEGEETCSEDSSQILICQDYSWQVKKNCNLNFGQYCRQTVSGSFSCTDSGNSTEPTNPEPTEQESTDNEPEDNDPTEPEPEDNDPTEPEPEDNDPTEPEPEDNDPTEPDDTDHENTDIGTCADIFECQNACPAGDGNCSTECFYDGSTQAQNDFYAWKNCKTEHNYDYNEIIKDEACKNAMIGCGEVGDMTYGIPYGHAIINGSFEYIYKGEEGETLGDGVYIDGSFVTGTFGTSGNIIDPSSGTNGTYAYALLNEYTATHEKFLNLFQDYKDQNLLHNPIVRINIMATEPGTYAVGIGNDDKINIRISDWNPDTTSFTCDHAFGFGYLELGGTALAETYETGAKTLTINGEVDLFSYKNAPMYVTTSGGHDISSTSLVACQPQ